MSQDLASLEKALHARKSELRRDAVVQLAQRSAPEAHELLLQALVDAKRAIRRAASEALDQLASDAVFDLKAILMHAPPALRRNTLRALLEEDAEPRFAQARAALPLKEQLEAILCSLLDRNSSVRKQALAVLEAFRDDAPDPEKLESAIGLLQQARGNTLDSKAECLRELGELQADYLLPAMCAIVDERDKHPTLLEALLLALRDMGEAAAKGIPWLVDHLLAPHTPLDERALQSLLSLEPRAQAVSLVEDVLHRASREGGRRDKAIVVLGELGSRGSLPLLAELLRQESQHPTTVQALCQALVKLEHPDARALLEEQYEAACSSRRSHRRLALARALCYYGVEAGVDDLLDDLRDAPSASSAHLRALGALKNPQLAPLFLEFMAREGNLYEARLAAIEALGHPEQGHVAEQLRELMLDLAEYDSLRNAAAISLVYLAPAQLDPHRDLRLLTTLHYDRQQRIHNQDNVEAILRALQALAEGAQEEFERLLEEEAEDSDASLQYLDALKQRNRKFLPGLRGYIKEQEQPRFTRHRGLRTLQAARACYDAWLELNALLQEETFAADAAVTVFPDAFPQLRELLSQQPSAKLWQELCAHLDSWPLGDELQVVIAYVEDHLNAWPDELRKAPLSWVQDIISQQHQPRFRLVRHLEMARYTPVARERLAFLEWLPEDCQIHILDLSDNAFTSKEARLLSEISQLRQLKHLNVFYNNFGGKGLAYLLESPHYTQLESLNIQSNNIGNKGALLLAGEHGMTQLAELNVCSNRISETGARALAESPSLPALAKINLSRNNIPQGLLSTIRGLFEDRGVEVLLDDDGVIAF